MAYCVCGATTSQQRGQRCESSEVNALWFCGTPVQWVLWNSSRKPNCQNLSIALTAKSLTWTGGLMQRETQQRSKLWWNPFQSKKCPAAVLIKNQFELINPNLLGRQPFQLEKILNGLTRSGVAATLLLTRSIRVSPITFRPMFKLAFTSAFNALLLVL